MARLWQNLAFSGGASIWLIYAIDPWGLKGHDPALNRAAFGGTIAPMLKILPDGATTKLTELA